MTQLKLPPENPGRFKYLDQHQPFSAQANMPFTSARNSGVEFARFGATISSATASIKDTDLNQVADFDFEDRRAIGPPFGG